jgi:hypothetical protein
MPPVGFEHTISAGERKQTYAFDRAATGTGAVFFCKKRKHSEVSVVRRGAASLGNCVPTFLDHYVVSERLQQTIQQRRATWRPEVLSPKATERAPKTSEQYRSNYFLFRVCKSVHHHTFK